VVVYGLTNWTKRTNGTFATLAAAHAALADRLDEGDDYTIWEMIGEPTGVGRPVEGGLYRTPTSD
jgi:hypothetical protein